MTDDLFNRENAVEVRAGGAETFAYDDPIRPLRLGPIETPVVAQAVPLPLAGKYRVQWRLGCLVLCLGRCQRNSATVEQLHVLMWAIRDEGNSRQLRRVWNGSSDGITLRAWDDTLDDSLRLAAAAGLISHSTTGRQQLTELGQQLLEQVRSEDELLLEEKGRLDALGSISTTGMWRRLGSTTPRRTGGTS